MIPWEACLAATLVDLVTSAALVTVARQHSVSLTMSIDYLNPAVLGSVVEVEAKARPCLASQASMRLSSSSLDGPSLL